MADDVNDTHGAPRNAAFYGENLAATYGPVGFVKPASLTDVSGHLDALKAKGDSDIEKMLRGAWNVSPDKPDAVWRDDRREHYGLPRLALTEGVMLGSDVAPALASRPGFELLPGEALALVNEAMRSGTGKHGTWDWEAGVSFPAYCSKAIGHILDAQRGLMVDAGSAVTPIANAAADLLILLSCLQRGVARDVPSPRTDVRPCREFPMKDGGAA